MPDPKTFSLSLTGVHKATTAFLLFLPVMFLLFAVDGNPVTPFISLFLVLVFGVCYLFAPLKYQVSPESIVVKRLGPDVIIPFDSIIEVQPVELHYAIRTWGVGGFFGSYGWFYAANIGRFRAYVTRAHDLVMIKVKDRSPIVISPDDPQGFIHVANSYLKKA